MRANRYSNHSKYLFYKYVFVCGKPQGFGEFVGVRKKKKERESESERMKEERGRGVTVEYGIGVVVRS